MTSKPRKPTPQMMMPWHPGVTITTTRAAEILDCSLNTIIRMIEDGSLEGFRMRSKKRSSPYRVIAESVYRIRDERQKLGEKVTVTEAAIILGCSASTVRALIDDGDLYAQKMRDGHAQSYYLIRRSDVVALTHEWRDQAGIAEAQQEAPERSANAIHVIRS